MESLSIQTDFASSGSHNSAFSILPSPSTFFFSGPTFPSPTFEQYPTADYHEHFASLTELPALSHSTESSATPSAAGSERSASPASSYPSTPQGSPLPEPSHVAIGGDKAVESQFMSAIGQKFDGAADGFATHGFVPAHPSQHPFDCAPETPFAAPPLSAPLPHRAYAASNVDQLELASSLVQHQPAPMNHHVAAPQAQAAYAQQTFSLGAPQGAFVHPPQHHQHQHQHQVIAYSTGPMTHGNIAYALPHPAPPPAAIETPHGTYYFVPNVVPSSAPLPPAHEPIQLPTPPPMAAIESTPAPASNHAGYVQLANGLTAGVAIAQASKATRSSTGATATIQIGDQKIRLPVGQGKRGSTKRPAKKDQVKRFICPHPGCGRAFARNFNMQSHHKSHLGIREFNCPHCPKKFSRRHDRARHCSAVHDSHVDRNGNIAGHGSVSSGSPSASFDDEFDEHDDDKAPLVDLAD
ncbi:hypothetical protein JCM10212_000264 [Sporobolomyces blumeae]